MGTEIVDVVQTEGLLLGHSYLDALRAGSASQYLASDHNISYYVVDRDEIPTRQRKDGEVIYLVADPIQAVRTDAQYRVSLFCFPNQAIRYRTRYLGKFGPSERVIFAFNQHIDCSKEEEAVIDDAIAHSRLRPMSIPNDFEYL